MFVQAEWSPTSPYVRSVQARRRKEKHKWDFEKTIAPDASVERVAIIVDSIS